MQPAVIFLAVLCFSTMSTVRGDSFIASPLDWVSEKGHKLLKAFDDRLPKLKEDDSAERTRRDIQAGPEYTHRRALPYSSSLRQPGQ